MTQILWDIAEYAALAVIFIACAYLAVMMVLGIIEKVRGL